MTYESHMARDARIDIGALLGAVVRRLPRVVVITLPLLVATFVILMFMPRLYESSASILVEPRNNIYSRSVGEAVPAMSGNEAGVVSSQIELIKSRDTLMGVIDKLDLRSVPEFNGSQAGFSPLAIVGQLLGRKATPVSIDETVLKTLYDRLTVAQERDSRIISVSVMSTDPQLAADIANALANAHVARRAALSLSDTAEASSWLADEIAKLRVSVTAAETAVAEFKVNNDLFVGSNNTTLADQQLSAIATQITTAQERKNAALSRAALIRGMIERGQSIDGVADVRDSVVIQQLSEEKARLQGEKAQRSATLLSNHPAILALTAQIAEINNQITLEGRRVADALEAEARIEADLEASLQADLARAKSSASTATQDTVTLDSLAREAKAQRDLLEGYLQRYSEAVSRTEANSSLPDVRVVSVAAPSVTPASPKIHLFLIGVGLVSLLVQIGLIVFGELMSGRAVVPFEDVAYPEDEIEPVPVAESRSARPEVWEEPVVQREDDPAEPVAPEPEKVAFASQAGLPFANDPGKLEQLVALLTEAIRPADKAADEPVVAEVVPEPEPQPEPVVEPQVEPVQISPVGKRSGLPGALSLAELSSDLVLGRTHLLILAAHRSMGDCTALAEELVSDALSRGLSVALVDAGTGMLTEDPGLSDLSIDAASFGDVVQKSADNSFAEVPWGQGRTIDGNSTKPLTLVEALGDIYEVVVLMTGRVGGSSTLPMFYGLEGRLVLVAGVEDDMSAVGQTRERLLAAGFERCEVVAAPTRVAA